MTITEIRYKNARTLVDQAGSINKFADKIDKAPAHVSAFAGANQHKGIGNKIARQIENAFNLPEGWMDERHSLDDDKSLLLQAERIRKAYLNSTPEIQEAVERIFGIQREK